LLSPTLPPPPRPPLFPSTTLSRSAPWARRLLVLLFFLLLVLFAAGLWGTVVRPAAYEVRGEDVARAAPDLLLIRHQAVTALGMGDRKSTRLNSSHVSISYAVFCLK